MQAENNLLQRSHRNLKIMSNLLGKFIGEGDDRKVYEYISDSQWVAKLPKNTLMINERELFTYNFIKELGVQEFLNSFAPCKKENDLHLMRKVQPLSPGEYIIPFRWKSIKDYENYGFLDGKVVASDYQFNFEILDNKYYINVPVKYKDIVNISKYIHSYDTLNIKIEINPHSMKTLYYEVSTKLIVE